MRLALSLAQAMSALSLLASMFAVMRSDLPPVERQAVMAALGALCWILWAVGDLRRRAPEAK